MNKECEHNYRVLDVVYSQRVQDKNTEYKRTTTYFCTKCMHEVVKIKSIWSTRGCPHWHKGFGV
jgi:ribosomal protein L37AE/L43A